MTLTVGIAFSDDSLNDRGWLVDTDAVETRLDEECTLLESAPWTKLFDFRPTMERASLHLFEYLQTFIDHLSYVELVDDTLGVVTRYTPS